MTLTLTMTTTMIMTLTLTTTQTHNCLHAAQVGVWWQSISVCREVWVLELPIAHGHSQQGNPCQAGRQHMKCRAAPQTSWAYHSCQEIFSALHQLDESYRQQYDVIAGDQSVGYNLQGVGAPQHIRMALFLC